ncbi:hypothetical protein I0C86_27790 [Plantactinospora sp. S1510]|uniref:Uncharacterized protein n=1 Tax=Plantactinospora alkalitolerans TaxID=2789879 RepID=A0ABS0H3L9_9ACTN|nr:hypothetical protein [Plantactinospora alkalitolerans]MBF9132729.1 hypothetical protein [Plantactinospora alkalitolerans]
MYALPPPETVQPEPPHLPPHDLRYDPAQQAAAADLRSQVVRRLRAMNAMHAQHAWDRRYADPLCPFGLAFLYYEPDPRQPLYTLRTGTRLFLLADAPAELPRLLYEVAHQAFTLRQQGGDPYTTMTDRRDDLSPQARHLGVGVSSLDSRWATWPQIQRTADGVTDVPGRAIAYLDDGTSLLVDRGARVQYDEVRIRSTQTLTTAMDPAPLLWSFASSVEDLVDAQDPLGRQGVIDVFRRLADLHRAVAGGA